MRVPTAPVANPESVSENRNGVTKLSPLSSRKGLSHADSKAQTRARLIAVGRDHFLRDGFSNTTAESIAKEAGFTRGALHFNFGNKEGLLLEVARASHRTVMAGFEGVIASCKGKKLIATIREGVAGAFQDPNNELMLQFEIEAWRNKTLHSLFLQFQEETVSHHRILVQKVLDKDPSLYLPIDAQDFISGLDSLRRGLAMRLVLPQSNVTQDQSRRILLNFYDYFGFQIRQKDRFRKRRATAAQRSKDSRK